MLKFITKKLKKKISNTGGRNNQGKITSFHECKKHKQLYRKISFNIKSNIVLIKSNGNKITQFNNNTYSECVLSSSELTSQFNLNM